MPLRLPAIFPKALLERGEKENLNFSFSGLKTSVRYFLEKHPDIAKSPEGMADLCASVRHAIVDVLIQKTARAVESSGLHDVAVSGGVSANRALRSGLQELCQAKGWRLHLPAPELSTDNATMIGQKVLIKKQLWDETRQALGPLPVADAVVIAPGRLPVLVVLDSKTSSYHDAMPGDGIYPSP